MRQGTFPCISFFAVLPLVQCSLGCRRRCVCSCLHTCSPYTCRSQRSWCGPRSPASRCRASDPCSGQRSWALAYTCRISAQCCCPDWCCSAPLQPVWVVYLSAAHLTRRETNNHFLCLKTFFLSSCLLCALAIQSVSLLVFDVSGLHFLTPHSPLLAPVSVTK